MANDNYISRRENIVHRHHPFYGVVLDLYRSPFCSPCPSNLSCQEYKYRYAFDGDFHTWAIEVLRPLYGRSDVGAHGEACGMVQARAVGQGVGV